MLKRLSDLSVGDMFSYSQLDDVPRYVVLSINIKPGFVLCKNLKEGYSRFFLSHFYVNVIK